MLLWPCLAVVPLLLSAVVSKSYLIETKDHAEQGKAGKGGSAEVKLADSHPAAKPAEGHPAKPPGAPLLPKPAGAPLLPKPADSQPLEDDDCEMDPAEALGLPAAHPTELGKGKGKGGKAQDYGAVDYDNFNPVPEGPMDVQ